jgi:hypothetical protein
LVRFVPRGTIWRHYAGPKEEKPSFGCFEGTPRCGIKASGWERWTPVTCGR